MVTFPSKGILTVNKASISIVSFNSHANSLLQLFSKIDYYIKPLLKVRSFPVENTIHFFI